MFWTHKCDDLCCIVKQNFIVSLFYKFRRFHFFSFVLEFCSMRADIHSSIFGVFGCGFSVDAGERFESTAVVLRAFSPVIPTHCFLSLKPRLSEFELVVSFSFHLKVVYSSNFSDRYC